MAEARQDRRIQKTRLSLRTAMVSLIREKGFEALTVQDIIDRANVGRSTFYTHFKSKEDLLKGGIEMMRSSLVPFQRRAQAAPGKAEDRLFGFTRELFAHAKEHRDALAAMIGRRSGTVVQHQLHLMLADLVREDLAVLAMRRKRKPTEVEAVVQFVTAGLVGLLVAWLDELAPLGDTDLEALFRRMALPAVTAVLG